MATKLSALTQINKATEMFTPTEITLYVTYGLIVLYDVFYLHRTLPKFRLPFDPAFAALFFAGIEILLDRVQNAFIFITLGIAMHLIMRYLVIRSSLCDEYRTKKGQQKEAEEDTTKGSDLIG